MLCLIISIFLIIHLYQQKLVTSITTHVSKLFQLLADLLHVDNTYLYVFYSSSNSTENTVAKAQRLLQACHEELKFKGIDLKLAKCYWTLQYC